jgi:flagellar M-ring protein FliF
MDFLNKAFAQLADLFRSMTPAARITTGLLLLLVVVSLGYLFTYRVSGPDCDLMNGEPIPASYLPKMEAAFAKASLSQYEVRGAHILVPQGQKAAYMAALADADALPPNFGDALAKALKEGSVYENSKRREDRMKIARQRELAQIISYMNGVESASVLYDTEVTGGLNRRTVTTASVAVKPLGSEGLDPSKVSAIRHLVAGAIAGLKPENVTVADLGGTNVIYHGGDSDGGGSATDNLYVSLTQVHEQRWRSKILNALAYIPGVRVTPTVELDPERINRVKKVRYDPKGITVRQYNQDSSRTRENNAPGGRPGFQAQQPNMATALVATTSQGSTESEDDSKTETITAPNSEQTETEKEGLTPKRVAVAIGIPRSYFKKVWKERNPPAEGEEPQTPDQAALKTIENEVTAEIKQYVAPVLPAVEGVDDPTQLVTVTSFQDMPSEPMPAPSTTERALVWFGQHWGTLGMIGLAGFSLLVLRSMIRATPTGAKVAPAAAAGSTETEQKEERSAAAATARRLARFAAGGPSLRDELSDLVREDTDAAANILRTWIGSAS